jgi:hypothetical protein
LQREYLLLRFTFIPEEMGEEDIMACDSIHEIYSKQPPTTRIVMLPMKKVQGG